MKLFYCFFTCTALLLWGCGQNNQPSGETDTGKSAEQANFSDLGANSELTELGGFEFVHHTKNAGPKPKPGHIVQYNYRLFQGTTEVEGNFGNPPVGAYFPTDEEAEKDPKPMMEALRRMSPGDSLTLVSRRTNEKEGYYRYEIKCANIIELDKNVPIRKAVNEAKKTEANQ